MKAENKLRVPAVDLARGIALIAMAIFHFAWDLENFGIARAGLTIEPQWKYFARSIASSFLMLVGISSWLAVHNGFSNKSFAKRMAMVGGAAAIITIATWFATPNAFIFFGILHNIALSSLLILLFIRTAVTTCYCSSNSRIFRTLLGKNTDVGSPHMVVERLVSADTKSQ